MRRFFQFRFLVLLILTALAALAFVGIAAGLVLSEFGRAHLVEKQIEIRQKARELKLREQSRPRENP